MSEAKYLDGAGELNEENYEEPVETLSAPPEPATVLKNPSGPATGGRIHLCIVDANDKWHDTIAPLRKSYYAAADLAIVAFRQHMTNRNAKKTEVELRIRTKEDRAAQRPTWCSIFPLLWEETVRDGDELRVIHREQEMDDLELFDRRRLNAKISATFEYVQEGRNRSIQFVAILPEKYQDACTLAMHLFGAYMPDKAVGNPEEIKFRIRKAGLDGKIESFYVLRVQWKEVLTALKKEGTPFTIQVAER